MRLRDNAMKRLPTWFERMENLAIAATVVVVFVHLHFSWWWLPVFFLAFDASMAGYLVNNRAGAVCYNLAHAYVAPAVLLLSYVLTGTRWCAFAGLLWAFHIAGDRVLGYGLKFASSFQDTHLGRIGKQRLPVAWLAPERYPVLSVPGEEHRWLMRMTCADSR